MVAYEVSKPTYFRGQLLNKISDFKFFDGENGNGEVGISEFSNEAMFHSKCIKQLSCKLSLAKITLLEILQEVRPEAQGAFQSSVGYTFPLKRAI